MSTYKETQRQGLNKIIYIRRVKESMGRVKKYIGILNDIFTDHFTNFLKLQLCPYFF